MHVNSIYNFHVPFIYIATGPTSNLPYPLRTVNWLSLPERHVTCTAGFATLRDIKFSLLLKINSASLLGFSSVESCYFSQQFLSAQQNPCLGTNFQLYSQVFLSFKLLYHLLKCLCLITFKKILNIIITLSECVLVIIFLLISLPTPSLILAPPFIFPQVAFLLWYLLCHFVNPSVFD